MKRCLVIRITGSVLACALVFLFAGCVSKSQHQELVGRYDKLKGEKAAAEQSCDANIEQMVGQISELEQQATGFQQQNDDLAARISEMSIKDEQLQKKNAQAEELKAMISSLQENLAGQQAIVSQLEDTLKIEVVDKLMFKSGSARVSASGSKILSRIAPVLKSATDKEIIVVGHTDDLPPSKRLAQTYPSNWELSAARAAALVHILTWEHKIDPARITIQGAAHYHPITMFDTKNKDYRKTNRVVEIILKSKTP